MKAKGKCLRDMSLEGKKILSPILSPRDCFGMKGNAFKAQLNQMPFCHDGS